MSNVTSYWHLYRMIQTSLYNNKNLAAILVTHQKYRLKIVHKKTAVNAFAKAIFIQFSQLADGCWKKTLYNPYLSPLCPVQVGCACRRLISTKLLYLILSIFFTEGAGLKIFLDWDLPFMLWMSRFPLHLTLVS